MVPQLIDIRVRPLLGSTRWHVVVLEIPLQHVLSIVILDVSIDVSRLVCVNFTVFVGLLSVFEAILWGSSGKNFIILMVDLSLLICSLRNALPRAFNHLILDRYFGIIDRLLRLVFPLS